MSINYDYPERAILEVTDFSPTKLAEFLKKGTNANIQEISSKHQYKALCKYFEKLDRKPETIVFEHEYIDKGYLNDFSIYHVKCFKNFKRQCCRLHFFATKFNQEEFESFLMEGDPNDEFRKKLYDLDLESNPYIGSIVVRPLYQRMIGRTTLKVPTAKDKDIKFPTTYSCTNHLCGISLTVESLPFQEQDVTVSACATSAVWVALNKTAQLFNHPSLSAAEITLAATTGAATSYHRDFPNQGLTLEQMINSLKSVKLSPEIHHFTEDGIEYDKVVLPNKKFLSLLKKYVYAYLHCGIPIILGVNYFKKPKNDIGEFLGKHAITIVGYGFSNDKTPESLIDDEVKFIADNIGHIYVHDDQIAPFTQLKFETACLEDKSYFYTKCVDNEVEIENSLFTPEVIVVPLNHKIRIGYDEIQDIVLPFNTALKEMLESTKILLEGKLKTQLPSSQREEYEEAYKLIENGNKIFKETSWDLSLYCLNQYKKDIWNSKIKPVEIRGSILEASLPRFFWRCSLMRNNERLFDLLLDATGIPQDNLLCQFLSFDQPMGAIIALLLECSCIEEWKKQRGNLGKNDYITLHVFERMRKILLVTEIVDRILYHLQEKFSASNGIEMIVRQVHDPIKLKSLLNKAENCKVLKEFTEELAESLVCSEENINSKQFADNRK